MFCAEVQLCAFARLDGVCLHPSKSSCSLRLFFVGDGAIGSGLDAEGDAETQSFSFFTVAGILRESSCTSLGGVRCEGSWRQSSTIASRRDGLSKQKKPTALHWGRRAAACITSGRKTVASPPRCGGRGSVLFAEEEALVRPERNAIKMHSSCLSACFTSF